MRRGLVRAAVGLAAVAVTVCAPALGPWPNRAEDPMTIRSLDVEVTVSDDGTLRATELIEVDDPVDDRHGIVRHFSHADPNAPGLRRVPHDVTGRLVGDPDDAPTSATLLTTTDRGRATSLRIGSPDVTLPAGTHSYEVTYAQDDVLLADGDRSRWVWNVVPSGWSMSVDEARVTVRLPFPADDATCEIGLAGQGVCEVAGAGTRTLEVTATGLTPRTPVTVRAGLAGPAPAVPADLMPWPARWDPVLGARRGEALTILGAALAALALGGAVTLAARRREPAPSPLQLRPPPGLGPVQARYLLTGRVPEDALTVSFVQAAARGAVTLTSAKHHWVVDRVPGTRLRGLDDVTEAAVIGLRHGSLEVAASPESAQEVRRRADAVQHELTRWAARSGLVRDARWVRVARVAWVVVAAVAVLLAVVGLFGNPFGPTAWALVPALLAVASVGVWAPGARSSLTAAGRQTAADVVGFREQLRARRQTTPSTGAGPGDGTPLTVDEELPWAFGLGVLDAWAAGVPQVPPRYVRASTGSPDWVYDLRAANAHAAAVVVPAVALGGALGAATASGTSGTAGGGLGGAVGGGGDGGGGSW